MTEQADPARHAEPAWPDPARPAGTRRQRRKTLVVMTASAAGRSGHRRGHRRRHVQAVLPARLVRAGAGPTPRTRDAGHIRRQHDRS
jgi:hypothetical protein